MARARHATLVRAQTQHTTMPTPTAHSRHTRTKVPVSTVAPACQAASPAAPPLTTQLCQHLWPAALPPGPTASRPWPRSPPDATPAAAAQRSRHCCCHSRLAGSLALLLAQHRQLCLLLPQQHLLPRLLHWTSPLGQASLQQQLLLGLGLCSLTQQPVPPLPLLPLLCCQPVLAAAGVGGQQVVAACHLQALLPAGTPGCASLLPAQLCWEQAWQRRPLACRDSPSGCALL